MVKTLAFALAFAAVSVTALPTRLNQRNNNGTYGGKFTNLVVFGDSFSDDGHGAWVVSNGTYPDDPAYYQHMFSNGPVWPLVLSQTLGISSGLTDLAVGGATVNNALVQGVTGPNADIPVPSVLDQIETYISLNSSAKANAIYAIVIGANDHFYNPNVTAEQVVSIIANGMQRLHLAEGATSFLLMSYPNLAALPFAQATPPEYQASLSDYASSLASGISSLASNPLPGMQVAYTDVYSLSLNIQANLSQYGFTTLDSCLKEADPTTGTARSVCTDPDQHVFWDLYHPTAKVHKLIAAEAANSLAQLNH